MKLPKLWHLGALVLSVAITASTFPACAQVVCLGASLTAGYTVPLAQAYPAQLEAMLRAKGYTGRVANEGMSGDTTRGMLTAMGKTRRERSYKKSSVRLAIGAAVVSKAEVRIGRYPARSGTEGQVWVVQIAQFTLYVVDFNLVLQCGVIVHISQRLA